MSTATRFREWWDHSLFIYEGIMEKKFYVYLTIYCYKKVISFSFSIVPPVFPSSAPVGVMHDRTVQLDLHEREPGHHNDLHGQLDRSGHRRRVGGSCWYGNEYDFMAGWDFPTWRQLLSGRRHTNSARLWCTEFTLSVHGRIVLDMRNCGCCQALIYLPYTRTGQWLLKTYF